MKKLVQWSALYICIIFLETLYPLNAQNNFWQQLNGPMGDAVTAVAFKSSGPTFCGTRFKGIFRSTNNGDTWTQINTGLTNLKILSILVLPSGEILAGSHGSGFFRSTNNGDTWNEFGGLITPAVITATMVQTTGNLIASTYRGIFTSSNGGSFWRNANKGIGNDPILCLAMNASGHIFGGSLDSGIFRSTNNGTNWSRINAGLPPNSVLSIAVHSNGSIYLGTDGAGMYKSTDNGNTWTQVNIGSQYKSVSTISIAANGDILTALNFGAIRSTDGGNTWSPLHSDLSNSSILTINFNASNHIFVGTWGGDLFRSINNGGTWSKVTVVTTIAQVHSLFINNNIIYAGTVDDGIFTSSDNGSSWRHLTLPTIRYTFLDVRCMMINAIGQLLSGTEGYGVYLSTDSGVSWKPTNNGLTNLYAYDFAMNSSGTIFLGTGGGGVFRSTNNGASWQEANILLTNNLILCLKIKQSNGYLFAGTGNGGVFRSTDNANIWDEMNTGLTNKIVNSLAVNSSGYLFAGTSGDGIFRSTNNGTIWQKALPIVTTSSVTDLVINSLGYFFAGTAGAGVYRSKDDANTWSQINSGLVNKNVNALAFDPAGYLYAGTNAGVMRSLAPTTTTSPIISLSSSQMNFSNVPVNNPSTKQLEISNLGDGNLVINSVSITSGTDFTTNFSTPATIQPGQKMNLPITFKPKMAGPQSAVLTIQSNDLQNLSLNVNLSGTGFITPKPKIVVNGSQLDFGTVKLSTITRKYLVVENQGTALLTISILKITGANANDFSIVNAIPMNIAASSRDSIGVDYNPTVTGSSNALLQITHNDTDQNAIPITLVGTAITAGNLSVNSTSIDFGTLKDNDPSQTRSLIVENTGDLSVNITRQQISGPSAPEFRLVRNLPLVLAAHVKDSLVISFTPDPVSLGTKSATLTIESDGTPSSKIDVAISAKVISTVSVEAITPVKFELHQNYPNPFSDRTTISFNLTSGVFDPTLSLNKEREEVGNNRTTLKVFDVFGRELLDLSDAILNNWELRTGNCELTIDNSPSANQLPAPGIYFYRLAIGNQSQTKIMMLIR